MKFPFPIICEGKKAINGLIERSDFQLKAEARVIVLWNEKSPVI